VTLIEVVRLANISCQELGEVKEGNVVISLYVFYIFMGGLRHRLTLRAAGVRSQTTDDWVMLQSYKTCDRKILFGLDIRC
jgi:hypothetical protein